MIARRRRLSSVLAPIERADLLVEPAELGGDAKRVVAEADPLVVEQS